MVNDPFESRIILYRITALINDQSLMRAAIRYKTILLSKGSDRICTFKQGNGYQTQKKYWYSFGVSFDDFLFMNLGTTRSNILNNDKFNSNFNLVANVIKFSAKYYTFSIVDSYR